MTENIPVLKILGDIANHADQNTVGGTPLLGILLQSYKRVLTEHGIDHTEDSFFHQQILELSTSKGTTWSEKLQSLFAERHYKILARLDSPESNGSPAITIDEKSSSDFVAIAPSKSLHLHSLGNSRRHLKETDLVFNITDNSRDGFLDKMADFRNMGEHVTRVSNAPTEYTAEHSIGESSPERARISGKMYSSSSHRATSPSRLWRNKPEEVLVAQDNNTAEAKRSLQWISYPSTSSFRRESISAAFESSKLSILDLEEDDQEREGGGGGRDSRSNRSSDNFYCDFMRVKMCFNRWRREFHIERERRIRREVNDMKNSKATSHWRRIVLQRVWAPWVLTSRSTLKAERHAQQHLMNYRVKTSISCWKRKARCSRVSQQQTLKALIHWARWNLRSRYNQWHGQTCAITSALTLEKTFLVRNAFSSWKNALRLTRVSSLLENNQVAFRRQRALAVHFSQWKQVFWAKRFLEDRKARSARDLLIFWKHESRRRKMSRRRCKMSLLAVHFSSWRNRLQHLQLLQDRLATTSRTKKLLTLRKIFSRWSQASTEMAVESVARKQSVKNSMKLALQRWRSYSRRHSYLRIKEAITRARCAQFHLVQNSFFLWRSLLSARMLLAFRLDRALAARALKVKDNAVALWVDFVRERRLTRLSSQALELRVQERRKAAAFQHWKRSYVEILRAEHIRRDLLSKRAYQQWRLAKANSLRRTALLSSLERQLVQRKALKLWRAAMARRSLAARAEREIHIMLAQRYWNRWRGGIAAIRTVQTANAFRSGLVLKRVFPRWKQLSAVAKATNVIKKILQRRYVCLWKASCAQSIRIMKAVHSWRLRHLLSTWNARTKKRKAMRICLVEVQEIGGRRVLRAAFNRWKLQYEHVALNLVTQACVHRQKRQIKQKTAIINEWRRLGLKTRLVKQQAQRAIASSTRAKKKLNLSTWYALSKFRKRQRGLQLLASIRSWKAVITASKRSVIMRNAAQKHRVCSVIRWWRSRARSDRERREKREQRRIRKADSARDRRLVRGSFGAWVHVHHNTHLLAEHEVAVKSMLRQKKIQKCLELWSRVSAASARRRTELFAADIHSTRRWLNVWRGRASRASQWEQSCIRWRQHKFERLFHSWRRTSRLRRSDRRLVQTRRLRTLGGCMSRWVNAFHSARRRRAYHQHASQLYFNKAVGWRFTAWFSAAMHKRAERKHAKMMKNCATISYLRTIWRRWNSKMARRQELVSHVQIDCQLNRANAALFHWRELARWRRRIRVWATGMRIKRFRGVWAEWRNLSMRRHQLRLRAISVCRLRACNLKALVLRSWTTASRLNARYKTLREAAECVLSSHVQRLLHGALTSWEQAVKSQQENRRLLKSYAQHKVKPRIFRAWTRYSRSTKQALQFLISRRSSQVFSAWRRALRVKKMRHGITTTVIVNTTLLRVKGMLQDWHTRSKRLHLKRASDEAYADFCTKSTDMAVQRWMQFSRRRKILREAKSQRARRADMFRTLVCLRAWKARQGRMANERLLLQLFEAKNGKSKQLRKSYLQWKDALERRRKSARFSASVDSVLIRGLSRAAVVRWHGCVLEARLAKHLAARKAMVLRFSLHIWSCGRAFQLVRKGCKMRRTRSILATWLKHLNHRRATEKVCAQVVALGTLRSYKRVLVPWRIAAAARGNARARAKQTAFRTWRIALKQRRAARARLREAFLAWRRASIRSQLAYGQSNMLFEEYKRSCAINRWRGATRHRVSLRATAFHLRARVAQRYVRNHLLALREGAARNIVRRIRRRAALAAWRNRSQSTARLKSVGAAVVRLAQLRHSRTALRAWVYLLRSRLERKASLQSCLLLYQQSRAKQVASRCFASWLNAHRLNLSYRRLVVGLAMRRWKRTAHMLRCEETAALVAANRERRLQLDAFRALVLAQKLRIETRRVGNSFLSIRAHAKLSSCFHRMRTLHLQTKAAREERLAKLQAFCGPDEGTSSDGADLPIVAWVDEESEENTKHVASADAFAVKRGQTVLRKWRLHLAYKTRVKSFFFRCRDEMQRRFLSTWVQKARRCIRMRMAADDVVSLRGQRALCNLFINWRAQAHANRFRQRTEHQRSLRHSRASSIKSNVVEGLEVSQSGETKSNSLRHLASVFFEMSQSQRKSELRG
eukprot:jgi/Bigna1/86715/estExt_fgenesh1_pg.C_130041